MCMYKKVWLLNHLTDTKKKLRGHSYRLLKHLPKGFARDSRIQDSNKAKKINNNVPDCKKREPLGSGIPTPLLSRPHPIMSLNKNKQASCYNMKASLGNVVFQNIY